VRRSATFTDAGMLPEQVLSYHTHPYIAPPIYELYKDDIHCSHAIGRSMKKPQYDAFDSASEFAFPKE